MVEEFMNIPMVIFMRAISRMGRDRARLLTSGSRVNATSGCGGMTAWRERLSS
jgi:hypothetical protein